jgi:hypothetical protein
MCRKLTKSSSRREGEHGEAHALLVRVVTDPDWQVAGQALDELMGRLLVVRRLLAAEQRLPRREPGPIRSNA